MIYGYFHLSMYKGSLLISPSKTHSSLPSFPFLPPTFPPFLLTVLYTYIFLPDISQQKHDLYSQAAHHLVREVDK